MPSNHLILCVPFSSCLQSFPASGSFPVSQLFSSGGQSIGASASASVILMNIQGWYPLGWTDWISLLSKGLPRVFSSTKALKRQFFGAQAFFMVQLSHPYMTTGKIKVNLEVNQGKLEVVKQEMVRVNIDILGISGLKWTGMGKINSDDHFTYYCGKESLRKNWVALIVNKRVQNAVLGSNLKNDVMISVHFQGKPFSVTVIKRLFKQLYLKRYRPCCCCCC